MNKDLYDVLKMQQDEMQDLVCEVEKNIKESEIFNIEAKRDIEESENKFQENLEWFSSLCISTDDVIKAAIKKADNDADILISDIEKNNNVFERKSATYDDLVERAHSKGYVNTKIQELLTEDEIYMADERLESIENEFRKRTRLKKVDIAFLTTAIVLQVVRQYVITPFSEKKSADEGAKIMDEKYGKGGKLKGKYYYATEDTIICQKKVPFDVIAGSKKFGLGKDNKGLDGNSHRFRSLGHDPVLGYLFGTANIVTNTVTWWNGTSHHIRYQANQAGVLVPTIASNANTIQMFHAVVDRFNGKHGKRILVEAIVKEHLHLKSDVTTDGLPLPFLQAISPDFAQTLAEFGLDAVALGDVAKQASGAEFINFIISTIHSLICAEKGEIDCKLYKVRTKKIILISNVIASASNIIAVGIATGVGVAGENPETVKKALKYLDIGGLLVTITHLFKDLRFIAKVKEEFINNKLDVQLIEELDNLDRYLNE